MSVFQEAKIRTTVEGWIEVEAKDEDDDEVSTRAYGSAVTYDIDETGECVTLEVFYGNFKVADIMSVGSFMDENVKHYKEEEFKGVLLPK